MQPLAPVPAAKKPKTAGEKFIIFIAVLIVLAVVYVNYTTNAREDACDRAIAAGVDDRPGFPYPAVCYN